MDRIDELPAIPEPLRRYAKEGRLTPFIGAGASLVAESDCPTWSGFASRLLGQLVEHDAIDHGKVHQIGQKALNPRVQISVARNIARANGIDLNFVRALHPNRNTSSLAGRRLYGAIGKLAQSFVTTNYDVWLDQAFEATDGSNAAPGARRNLVSRPDDISIRRLREPNTVIHLHGSLEDADPSNMIMTTADYLGRYAGARDENPIVQFLTDLFRTRSVLFIGYGLDELEILEYILLKKRLTQARSPLQHYILQPFFSHELTVAEFLEKYFAECGVTLIPYNVDRNSYPQLIEVLEGFAAEIPSRNILNIARRTKMEGLLDDE